MILTDGIFSMDGDIAPLPNIVSLAEKYDAIVFIDDAHATGVLGEHGRGTIEHFHLDNKIDFLVTTFSKAFGVVGGLVAAKKEIIKYLRVTAKTYIFSGAFLPSLATGILQALELLKNDKQRRFKLWENTNYLKKGLNDLGFNTLKSETPIVPILIGDENVSIQMARDLYQEGVLAPPIRWPAVEHGKSRMRFTLTPEYTKEQIDFLLKKLQYIGTKYKIIK